MLSHKVKVNRARNPKEVLDSTKRKQFVKSDILRTMPQEKSSEVELVLFRLPAGTSGARVMEEYESRSLKPDPYALAAVCEASPEFADNFFPVVQWKLSEGDYGFLAFLEFLGEPYVTCGRVIHDWSEDNWFAGVAK